MKAWQVGCLLFSVIFFGCSEGGNVVEVEISQNKYMVRGVESGLATDVVDEVVRLRPGKVHIKSCLATPPGKIQQFNIELNARLKVDTEMTLNARGC